jgi:hypothetical protein
MGASVRLSGCPCVSASATHARLLACVRAPAPLQPLCLGMRLGLRRRDRRLALRDVRRERGDRRVLPGRCGPLDAQRAARVRQLAPQRLRLRLRYADHLPPAAAQCAGTRPCRFAVRVFCCRGVLLSGCFAVGVFRSAVPFVCLFVCSAARCADGPCGSRRAHSDATAACQPRLHDCAASVRRAAPAQRARSAAQRSSANAACADGVRAAG